jgi:transcriptional regulator with XRE-family HTH domain
MPRRGYPLEGHRAGGITRLAADTGISQATMSRMVNGLGEPSVDSLRKIGNLWSYTLQEMMVFAGFAEAGDHPPVTHLGQVQIKTPEPIPGVRVEQVDETHVQVSLTIDTGVSMEDAIKRVEANGGPLTDNEQATVTTLRNMGHAPVEVAGLILMLRGLVKRRAEQSGPERRNA